MRSDSTQQGTETAAEKDARIRQNIEVMSSSKDWSQQEIRDFLSSEEGVNPDDYLGARAGVGRALGLGARSIVQGAGAVAALPGNLVNMAGMGLQMSPMGGGSLTPHSVLPPQLTQGPMQAAA